MSIFSNLTNNGLEEQKDTLGGFTLLDSDIYPAKIKVAYAGRSASGAMNVTIHADIDGKEYRETIYITNKDGINFYEKDGKKIPLAGFAVVNDICQLAAGKPLSQMDTEDKMLMIYSTELQKEVATKVPVLMDLLDTRVDLGIVKEKRFKAVKDSNGNYVDSDETRESNVINKAFHPETHQTVYEIAHNLNDSPLFYDKWLNKNKGQVMDRTRKGGRTGSNMVSPSVPQRTERKSLFN